jgi:hypothetical protein
MLFDSRPVEGYFSCALQAAWGYRVSCNNRMWVAKNQTDAPQVIDFFINHADFLAKSSVDSL